MASRRCPKHKVKYPFTMVKEGGGCPVPGCKEKQESHPHMPHDGDWEQKVAALTLMQVGGYPDEPSDPMRMDTVHPSEFPGLVTVTIDELDRCGYKGLSEQNDRLIRSRGLYYETVHLDAPNRLWFLQIVDVPAFANSIPVLDHEPDLEGRVRAVSKDRKPPPS